MQFDFLKQFNPKNGERYVIIEHGKPEAVVLSFEDYQKISNSKNTNADNNGDELPEPIMSEVEGFSGPEETEIDFNNEAEDDGTADNEDNKQKVAELKNELKRELTLDDLPF